MLSTKLKEAAGNSADATLYVDDVFSTYLYTGNGSTQTITNGIDLAGKGGLVWIKSRSAATDHKLTDTTRGATKALISDTTGAETTDTTGLTAFSSTGFSLGASSVYNTNAATYVSWTFRESANFFDVVTYTGDGVNNRAIAHSLGVAPGMIVIKSTSNVQNWPVYHISTGGGSIFWLNSTYANIPSTAYYPLNPTASSFYVGTNADVNASGQTYVAYLFAHDTSSTGIIQCGTYNGTGGDNTITLGWEPQYLMIKKISDSDANSYWSINDSMRGGLTAKGNVAELQANSSAAQDALGGVTTGPRANATGFSYVSSLIGAYNASGSTYIYMAIRRPNKPPTTGTQVFGLSARTGSGANATVTGGQTGDAVLIKNRGSAVADLFSSRLTSTGYLVTSSTAAEVAAGTTILQGNPWDVMDGVKVGTTSTISNASANTFINYLFKRAPGFFDVVCYTGTGVATTQAHNLTVAPELMIVKWRNGGTNQEWAVYAASEGATKYAWLNSTGAFAANQYYWSNATPTSSVFSIGPANNVNNSGWTYVAYLFATLAGISKVGSYTGNGTSQNIDCGFAAGARFVLIKRTDSTGDWYVWDSARGIVSGNDPHLSLNTTAAEVTTDDSVDPYSAGFTVNQVAATNINVSSATYIFLAIA